MARRNVDDPRTTYRYQKLRAQLRPVHEAQQRHCELGRCLFRSRFIDYRLRYPHPASWSLDHVVALQDGGALLDLANTQASHLRCNQSRGAVEGNLGRKAETATQRYTSARW